MKSKNLTIILIALLLASSFYFLASAPLAFAQDLKPDCRPELPPGQPGSCDLNAAVTFLKKVINFMIFLIVPLAALFIVWGGFVMLTSAGSEEKFKKGKQIVTAAVIGVAIAFGSYLIVNTILTFFAKNP